MPIESQQEVESRGSASRGRTKARMLKCCCCWEVEKGRTRKSAGKFRTRRGRDAVSRLSLDCLTLLHQIFQFILFAYRKLKAGKRKEKDPGRLSERSLYVEMVVREDFLVQILSNERGLPASREVPTLGRCQMSLELTRGLDVGAPECISYHT